MSKAGIQPSNINVKAIAEYAPPQTYTEIRAFLGLVGHYRCFIKGFAQIAQPLNEHLAGEGTSRKSEQVSLSEGALKAFEMLKQACMNSPVLAFTDYTKDFLLETDTSKEGLGAVLSQKQEDGWFHPVAYGSQVLTTHEKNYHSTKLEFLALKWAVMEHFKEYLLYQPFLVCSTPKGEDEDLLLFMVPKAHWTAALNGCHWDAGHQGCDHTLSLLQECFWWPGMAKQMRQVIKTCRCCLQYEGGTPRAPLCPIVATT